MSQNEESSRLPRTRGRRSSIRMSIDTYLIENNLFHEDRNSACIAPTQEFMSRVGEATRAFFVAIITMTILILPGEGILPSPWLGSVIAMRALRPTLGDTIIVSSQIFIPIIPVAGVGYGLAALMDSYLDTTMYSILLPFVSLIGTLIIMLCPYPFLTKKNLMLVVFYMMVASPLSVRNEDVSYSSQQESLPKWFLASFLATIVIGLSVSLGVHFVLLFTPRSTTATRLSLQTMGHLSYTTFHFLNSIHLYTSNLGKDSQSVMRARSLIDFFISSRKLQMHTLNGYIDGIRAESLILGCNTKYNHVLKKVEEFTQCAKRQQQHAEIIRLASRDIFLGEEYTEVNETVRHMKSIISDNLGLAIESLAHEFQQAEKAYFFDASQYSQNSVNALNLCLAEYILAMKKTIEDTDKMVSADELGIDSSVKSLKGTKIRMRVVQMSIYSLAHELIDVITQDTQMSKEKQNMSIGSFMKTTFHTPWLHKNPLKLRHALKTGSGMMLASLWASIPYLREEISYPNSIWVGITVAIVSLEHTGSTVTKCIDRLWGNLVAGAFALLMAKLLPYEITYFGIVSYAIFAFVAILLKNPERAYANECAVTSLASILFGSLYNEFEVYEYVTQRIMLIFVGVATFLFVELTLFARSSRSVVKACVLNFFDDLNCFLLDATKVCRSIPTFKDQATQECDQFEDEPLFMLRHGHKKMSSYTSNLADRLSQLKDTISIATKELQPAIAEPSLGLQTKLHGVGYEKLLREQDRCISQLEILITCINTLIGYYSLFSKDATIREFQRPDLIADITDKISQHLQICIHDIKVVFPRGLCEPGSCSVSNIIASLSRFRYFEAIRVFILTKSVANSHVEYSKMNITSEDAHHITGFRTTVALAASSVLTIAQSLQLCGLYLEEIARAFPLESKDFDVDFSSRDG